MIPLALAAIRLLSFSRFRDTRKRGVETSFVLHPGRFSAGWHARMSSRLAGKGACALCSASVSNIRLRPSPRLDTGGRQMRIRKHTALISGLIALHVPSFAAAATRSPVRPPAKALTPPASFLQLCVASRDAPMEFRLYRLVDLLKENRRAVTWQRRGGAWIMRERWFDDLARRPHEIAFELTPMTGMATGRYCPKDRVEASVSRLVFDGVELTDMAFIKTLNAQTDAVYAADRPPPDVPSASTTP